MIKTARQLKDLIRNLSRKNSAEAEEVFDEVENSLIMQSFWSAYQKKFSYATDLEWSVIMEAIHRLNLLQKNGNDRLITGCQAAKF